LARLLIATKNSTVSGKLFAANASGLAFFAFVGVLHQQIFTPGSELKKDHLGSALI